MSSSDSANYHPDGTLFIVSGPSGAGKTTLIDRVREELSPLGLQLHFSVSHTTRVARSGEMEDVSYYYVPKDAFEQMVERGEFIEWARVHDQMYGTSNSEVQTRLDRGEDVILDIDVQGARKIYENKRLQPHSLSIFVFPPSAAELQRRLQTRGLNSPGEIERRVQKAFEEIESGLSFYDYVIINEDVKRATECLKAAILARKLKTKQALSDLQMMARRFKEEHGRTTRGD